MTEEEKIRAERFIQRLHREHEDIEDKYRGAINSQHDISQEVKYLLLDHVFSHNKKVLEEAKHHSLTTIAGVLWDDPIPF